MYNLEIDVLILYCYSSFSPLLLKGQSNGHTFEIVILGHIHDISIKKEGQYSFDMNYELCEHFMQLICH